MKVTYVWIVSSCVKVITKTPMLKVYIKEDVHLFLYLGLVIFIVFHCHFRMVPKTNPFVNRIVTSKP